VEYLDIKKSRISLSSILTFIIFGLVVILTISFSILDYKNTKGSFAGVAGSTLAKCFSVGRNAREIFYSKEYSDPHLKTLDGLCVFSMMWIICASGFYYFGISPLTNKETYEKDAEESYFFHVMLAATFTFNVFFFISGFLCAIKLTEKIEKELEETPTYKIILLSYLQRILRLLPLYFLGILILMTVIPFIYSGQPLSSIIEWQGDKCQSNYWQNLLFIQNFFTQRDACMPWTSYFAADFQLFLITPIVIIIYTKNNKFGIFAALGLCFVSIVTQVVTVVGYDLPINQPFFGTKTSLDIYYSKPYINMFAYFVGILLGWHYLSSKNGDIEESSGFFDRLLNNSIMKFVLVLLGTSFISACVSLRYVLRDSALEVQSAYLILGNFLFLVGVLMIFYPAILGKYKLIYLVFGASLWGPLRKLGFGAFMFHVVIILTEKVMDYHASYYTFMRVFLSAIHVFCLAYFVSFLLTVFFEAPLRQLQRVYLFETEAVAEDDDNLTELAPGKHINTTEPLLENKS